MTASELEAASYSAAHKIYAGLPAPDRATPGGYRSRMIDQIAEVIQKAFPQPTTTTHPDLISKAKNSG